MRSDPKRNQDMRDKLSQLNELGVTTQAIATGCNEYRANLARFQYGKRNMTDATLDKVEAYLSTFKTQLDEILKGED